MGDKTLAFAIYFEHDWKQGNWFEIQKYNFEVGYRDSFSFSHTVLALSIEEKLMAIWDKKTRNNETILVRDCNDLRMFNFKAW